MNVPDKKTGVGRSVVREQGAERADYSANPPGALRVPDADGGLRLDLDRVATVSGPGSHLVAALAASDVIIEVPEDVTDLAEGDPVETWEL